MAHEYSPSAADLDKVTRANGSGRPPVVFVHGLWLLFGQQLEPLGPVLRAGRLQRGRS